MVALQGCVDATKGTRWPGHRKDHDARLDKLSEQVAVDDQEIAALAQRIAELEAALAHKPTPEAPTPPAP
ncbi:MAG: hypothetical protein ABI678_05270 [Kofleriaceae bacterium]